MTLLSGRHDLPLLQLVFVVLAINEIDVSTSSLIVLSRYTPCSLLWFSQSAPLPLYSILSCQFAFACKFYIRHRIILSYQVK